MSAIAPREYDEPTPRSERENADRNVSTEQRPVRSPMMKRFAFMWDGWHSIELNEDFVLA